MRKFIILLFLMCFLGSEAMANEVITWQAFALSGDDSVVFTQLLEENRSGKNAIQETLYDITAENIQKNFFGLSISISPPQDTYFYSHDTTYGLPTMLHGFVTREGHPEGVDKMVLGVFGPKPVVKSASSFASTKLAGVDDANALIYPARTSFVVLVPRWSGQMQVALNIQALFCSAKSCQPFFHNFELSFSDADLANLLPLENGSWIQDVQLLLVAPELESVRAVDGVYTGSAGEVTQNGAISALSEPGALPENSSVAYSDIYKSFKPRFDNPDLEVDGLWKALAFGLLAGLILNLMPCVLPVISLKFSALLMVSGYASQKEKERAFRAHCLFFSTGVLVWFMVLAGLLGLAGFAWGGLFQNPHVIAALGLLLFLLGLSLFDVFVLPVLDLRVNTSANPHWQAFASGVLATLLATPCSGPLLGGVLGWAVNQPLYFLVLTISSVGVGMALPYLLMAVFPGLVKLLPKPGAWTLRLEQVLGFFLMATVAYMTTLLPDEWLRSYIFILVVIAFAAWLWGQIGSLHASTSKRLISRICAVVLVVASVWAGYASLQEDTVWEQFDEATFNAALGQEHILVEFTADWCPSCKALEYTTLSKKRMRLLQSRYKMRTIKVDLTRRNLAGEALLSSLGSSSIPVIALFPAGDLAAEPLVLRDIVTPEQLDAALAKTFGN